MFYKTCLLLLPALVYGAHFRIQNGNLADVLDYPYQAAFELNGEHFCGAVIISESFALTTGNCYSGNEYYHQTIRVNTSISQAGGTVVRVKSAHLHPDFNSDYYDYNVVVLELAEPLTFGPGLRAAALPEVDEKLPKGALLTISGWGSIGASRFRPTTADNQMRTVNVVYYEGCEQGRGPASVTTPLTNRMICGGDLELTDNGSCFGSSGDPVAWTGKVYGLVTWSVACWKVPDVYVNLANREIREFIRFVTGV